MLHDECVVVRVVVTKSDGSFRTRGPIRQSDRPSPSWLEFWFQMCFSLITIAMSWLPSLGRPIATWCPCSRPVSPAGPNNKRREGGELLFLRQSRLILCKISVNATCVVNQFGRTFLGFAAAPLRRGGLRDWPTSTDLICYKPTSAHEPEQSHNHYTLVHCSWMIVPTRSMYPQCHRSGSDRLHRRKCTAEHMYSTLGGLTAANALCEAWSWSSPLPHACCAQDCPLKQP